MATSLRLSKDERDPIKVNTAINLLAEKIDQGVAGSSPANPTATIGLTAVNGSAGTHMRSDAAPALSQAIVPAWTGAHTFNPASGTAIAINPAVGTTAQGFNVTQTGPNTGSQSATNYNSIIVNDGANVSGGQFSNGLYIQHSLLSNVLGQKAALYVTSQRDTVATATTGDQIGIVSFVQVNQSNGGVSGTPQGTLYAINPIISTGSGATNYDVWCGGEVDMDLGGGNCNKRIGWSIVNAGAIQATVFGSNPAVDAALEISSSNTAGSWNNAILFTTWRTSGAQTALASTASIINSDGVAQTIANVINLPNWTISGNIFNFSTFGVSGAGVTTITPTIAANTSTDGLVLSDATAATSGNQQYSPRIRLTGQGWKTNATAASETVDWVIEIEPIQGTSTPGTKLNFLSQINGGGYSSRMGMTDDGSTLTVTYNGALQSQFVVQVAGVTEGALFTDGTQVLVGAVANVPLGLLVNNSQMLTLQTTGKVKFGNAASFSANGAVATSLGSVGPTGSHTTVQKWLTIVDNSGATLYIPAF